MTVFRNVADHLPEDRCGYSDGEQTCIRKAWHEEPHRMWPRTRVLSLILRPRTYERRADGPRVER